MYGSIGDDKRNVNNSSTAFQNQNGKRLEFRESEGVEEEELYFMEIVNSSFSAGGVKASTLTLAVSIVGAGMLSLGFAVQQSGILLSFVLFVLGAAASYFSLGILVVCADYTKRSSYRTITDHLLGKKFGFFVQIMILVNMWGTLITYMVASGSMIETALHVLFQRRTYLSASYIMSALTILFVLPLSLLRTMGALRFSSVIAAGCAIYLLLFTTITYFDFCTRHEIVESPRALDWIMDKNAQVPSSRGISPPHVVRCFWESGPTAFVTNSKNVSHFELPILNEDWANLMNLSPKRVLTTISLIIFAFTCHTNVLPIYLELQRPNERRMVGKVIFRAIAIALFLYLCVGLFSYMTFLDQLQDSNGNLLLNDYHHSPGVVVGNILMSIYTVLAQPIMINASRGNVREMFFHLDDLHSPLYQHVIITVIIVFASLIPAMLISDISEVFVLLGATTNPFICFILPAIYLLKAAPHGEKTIEKIAIVVIAIIATCLSLAALIYSQ